MNKIVFCLGLLLSGSLIAGVSLQNGKVLNAGAESTINRFYYQDSDLVPIDNGKKLYLGVSGMSSPKDQMFLFYTALDSMSVMKRAVPAAAFFSANRKLLINEADLPKGQANGSYTYSLKNVLYYDEEIGRAGLIFSNMRYEEGSPVQRARLILAIWDLKADKIVKARIISDEIITINDDKSMDRRGKKTKTVTVIPAGYDRETGLCYYALRERAGGYSEKNVSYTDTFSTIRLLQESPDGNEEIVSFTEQGSFAPKLYYDALTRTVLSVKYSEVGKNGTANLIDVVTKKMHTINTPLLTYCAVFDPDKTRLYLLSNKTGMIAVVNRHTGKVLQQFNAGAIGFRMGFVDADRLAFFNKSGVKIISTAGTLKLVASYPAGKYSAGHAVSLSPVGGVISQGNIVIGWSKILFHLKYQGK